MNTESLRASRKSQAPNPREIAIIKSQTKTSPGRSQFWSFGLGTYLGFGIWCLELLFSQNSFAQGPLTPPAGAPTPTMKTLTQIEPRTPIESLPFTISQSGSYYFTKNLDFTAASGDAITVSASDVTLDLMGFTLSSAAGVTGSGIVIATTAKRCTVKNGSILGTTTVAISGSFPNRTWTVTEGGFSSAVKAASGLAKECRFLDLTVSKCRLTGVSSADDCVAERCVATENGGAGLVAGTVANCTASGNKNNGINGATVTASTALLNGQYGISVFGGSVTGCTASNNGNDGISASVSAVTGCRANGNKEVGIIAESVTGCSASSNGTVGIVSDTAANCTATSNTSLGIIADTVTHCTASLNGSTGIRADTVIGCSVRENTGHGIEVDGTARDNLCSENGKDAGIGAGIYFDQNGVRIEGNNCYNNDWGIQGALSTNSFIVRNSCRGSRLDPINGGPSRNYDFPTSNTFGPILIVNGDMAGTAGASHPWANISY